jgi:hypothetical protein
MLLCRHGFGGSFDELAVDEGRASTDEGHEVWCVGRRVVLVLVTVRAVSRRRPTFPIWTIRVHIGGQQAAVGDESAAPACSPSYSF